MSRTKNKCRFFSLIGCISLLILSLAFAITACSENGPNKGADYYLSLESSGWQTYNSNEMIPKKVRFTSNGDLYTLEIMLDEGEKFTVNQVGSNNKFGFDKLFTSAEDLKRGNDDSIEVVHGGAFALTYNSVGDTLTYTYTAQPLSVEITPATTELHVGDSYPYQAKVTYSDGSNKEESAVWDSSDKAVLTVDESGKVTALSAGSATLTATAHGLTNTLDITVTPSTFTVTGVQLDEEKLSLELGAERKLQATVLPENADSKLVSWSSDDDSVATVSQDGTVKAVGYGTTTITVTTAQNGHTATCKVTVVKHVEALRFISDKLTVVAGGKTKELGLVYSPSDATDKEVEIEVVNGSEYATVDEANGTYMLRGLAEGKATVKATLKENHEITATCEVTVLAAGAELASMDQDIRVMIEATISLEVSLEKSAISNVDWSIADETVATVTGEGATATVKGVDFGSTVVTATVHAESGKTYTATCNVLVADEWYFIYGYGLGKYDWDFEDYVTDQNEAMLDELLFTEQSKGIYTLTRHLTPDNGFQIIFPQVASFTQYDDSTDEDVWSKNIPSHWVNAPYYYRENQSDSRYVKNSSEFFCVNAAGIYTITLDLTGTSATVYIKMVSLDVTEVQLELSDGNYVLSDGDEATISFTVSPANAAYTEKDVSYSLTSDYADYAKYLSCALDFADGTLKLSASAVPQSFTAVLHLIVNGIEQTLEFYVMPTGADKTAVTEIHFEQEKYEFNVNNGRGIWTTTVKALVNADATNKQVRYYDVTDYSVLLSHDSDERAIVDPVTGEVTARSLGTLKIQAVSLDDPSVSETVDVLFYSDQFYMIGGYGANYVGGWTAFSQDVTTLEGTIRESFAFTEVSHTRYTYEITPQVTSGAGKFKIVFLGMDDFWTGEINYSNIAQKFSNARFGWGTGYQVTQEGSGNIQFLVKVKFTLTIDLSIHKPVLLIDCANLNYAEDYVLQYSGKSDLNLGDTVTARLYTFPLTRIVSDEVEVSYQGNDGYMTHEYDETTNQLTFQAIGQEHAEDKQVTVSINVGDTTNTLTFTIVAAHHFVQKWDDDFHWLQCTDEVCHDDEECVNRIEQKKAHDVQQSYSANADGHYIACSECGVQLGLQPHECKLNNGVFDFSESMQECEVCHFKMFEIEGNKLVYYWGKAEVVKIPETVTIIGAHAFEGHTELTELTYSRQMSEFGEYAFAGCSNLKSISMTNFLTSIGSHAFDGTAAELKWGNSPRISAFYAQAFYGYGGTTITIPDTVGLLGGGCFAYSNIESIVIPSSVRAGSADLPQSLFQGCTSLRTVEIGAGIATMGMYGFYGCTSLETVIVRGTAFWKFNQFCFTDCNSLQAIYFERPLPDLLSCKHLFYSFDRNSREIVQGKCYAFSEENPGANPFEGETSNIFGNFDEWFAGCWHWDDSGKQKLKNIVIWETETNDIDLTTMPAILDDKRDFLA